jgi:predicted AlkP superfamily pyrophosphatase or phosphodiesterase
MHPTLLLNVVGLTPALVGEDTPSLRALARDGAMAPIRAITPAVTCSAQATYLTGLMPRDHGIVGNGWYFRDLAQVMFWKQSHALMSGERVWDRARAIDPSCTVANMFWWFNMYSSADWSVTPRPIYPADGRKILDVYSEPAGLRARLIAELGPFPFFSFWGPKSDIKSSEWIADASIKVDEWHSPTLLLTYLPHLDYNFQRLGPNDPRVRADVRAIDRICGKLIDHCRAKGRRILVVSEYGLTQVTGAIHINRILRDAGWLSVRDEIGLDAIDPGASEAFAVADHQIAHVHVKNPARIADVRSMLAKVPGIVGVLDRNVQRASGLDHPRAGDLVAISTADRWFTYYFWRDDQRAPDYARTVDIHRKPGYDPAELFVDPALPLPAAKVAWTLAKKKLGFRYLMSVIPLDETLVRGSHGRPTDRLEDGPVMISSEKEFASDAIEPTQVRDVILRCLERPAGRPP